MEEVRNKRNNIYFRLHFSIYPSNKEIENSSKQHKYEESLNNLGDVLIILEDIESFEFNIFKLNEISNLNTMNYITNEIFTRKNFFDSLVDEKIFRNFIKTLTLGYSRKVPYHNDIHAADVFQTVNLMLEKGKLEQVSLIN